MPVLAEEDSFETRQLSGWVWRSEMESATCEITLSSTIFQQLYTLPYFGLI